MKTITITQDDSGQLNVQVEQDGQAAGEPYSCESPDECLEYVGDQLAGNEEPADEEAASEPAEQDERAAYAQAWNDEASKRPIAQ